MKVILYRDKDKDQVIDLILGIQNGEFHLGLTVDDQPDLLDVNKSYRRSGGEFWVAVDDDDDVVGTIALMGMGNGYGVLKKFFVKPDFRSKKVGLLLYQTLMDFATENGFRVLVLDTPRVAHTAHAFYERNGFKRIAEDQMPVSYHYPDKDSLFYLKELRAGSFKRMPD